jgi:predicted secreted hydrolase
MRLTPQRTWRSALDGTAYPVEWTIEVPALELMLTTTAAIERQELNLAVRYWEGAIRARGTRAGRTITGRGYLEMTGYGAASAGALSGRTTGTR